MDNIKRHLSYILIAAMTAAFVIESFSLAESSFVYAGTGSGLPKVLKKPVRVLYVKNKKKKRIEYGRAAKHKSEGYSIFQGSCTDGRMTYHVLYNKRKAQKNRCRIIKVNPKTHKVIRVSRAYYIYHGNDIAFDSKRKRLVIVHGDGDTKRISVFDPSTLKRKKVIRLNFNRSIKGISRKKAGRIKGVTGIAYDGKHDRFIASVKSTFDYIVLTPKFKPLRYVHTKTKGDLQKQGMEISGKYILRIMNKYTKKSIQNYIYIYSMRGKYIKRVPITTNSEVESLYFLNDRLYASTYVERRLKKRVRRYSYILKCR